MTPVRRIPIAIILLVALMGAGLGALAGSGGSNHLLRREASSIEAPFVELAGGPITATPGGIGPVTSPLYVVVLETLGIRETGGIPAVRLRQAMLLGALVPTLTALGASLAFGAAAALPAGILALLPGALWLQFSHLVPFGWQALAAQLALLALIGIPGAAVPGAAIPSAVRGALAGGALVVARLLGAAWAPFLAVFVAIWLLRRRRLAALVAFAVTCLLIFVLPGALNTGRLRPIATAPFGLGGIEAWSGFQDGASGIDPRRGSRGLRRWQTLRDLGLDMERRLNRRVNPQEVVTAGYGRAREWAVSHPPAALALMVRKAFLSVSGYDPPSPESLAFRAREILPWARPLLPLAALVIGCGLTGLWLARSGRRPKSAPLAPDGADAAPVEGIEPAPFVLLLLATLVSAALYLARAGDRLALLVALAAPGGYALDRLVRATWPERRKLLPLLLGLPLVLSLPWLLVARQAESAAEDHFLVASLKARGGQNAEVIAQLESALRNDPGHAGARMALASALAQDGLYDQALSEITRVTDELPGLVAGWHFRALLLQQRGQYTEALAAYGTLTTLNPLNPEYWNNLGTMHVTLGNYDPAVAALTRALAVDSTYATARKNLAEVQARGPDGISGGVPSTGAPADGMEQIQRGVAAVMQALQAGQGAQADKIVADLRAAFGSTPDIDFAAATVHLQKGEVAPAIELYERCRGSMPGNPFLLNNLAAAYARNGELQKSIPLWEEILKSDPNNEMVRGNIEAARKNLEGR